MERNKWRVSHDRGFVKRRNTPRKLTLSRRHKLRRLLPNKYFEALPEENEVEEMFVPTVKPPSPVWAQSPAYIENPTHTAVSAATPTDKKNGYQVSPAWHLNVQMTPGPEDFKDGEMPNKKEDTPESITSPGMETETTFDDDEGCYSSASSSSNSIPSPEIFRKENYVERFTFPMKEELLGLHLHIKNSTLLDVSNAETINMHHPPDLSTIIGASMIFAEKNSDIGNHTGSEAETRTQTGSFQQDKQAKEFKGKTPEKITSKMPIKYKKKVSFKTPIIAETFEAKRTPVTKLTIHNTRESVQTSSLAEPMKPNADTSTVGEINFGDDAQHLRARLKKPAKSSPEKAKFFDFVSDSDRDVFFQRMRERSVKLTRTPLFPLTAVKQIQASVL